MKERGGDRSEILISHAMIYYVTSPETLHIIQAEKISRPKDLVARRV